VYGLYLYSKREANCIAFYDYPLTKFNLIWNVYTSLIRAWICNILCLETCR